jgi:hypothetical protein
MCDWSDFKTAAAYYKKCGDASKPKYDTVDTAKISSIGWLEPDRYN